MPFQIIRNDLTKMPVEAIVNAANTALQMGGGVCGAIFKAAGAEKLQKACNDIGHCEVGKAVATEAFDLPMKKILHTVGPIWRGGTAQEAQLLHNCYINTLELAEQLNLESVAFPLISAGIYGYPREAALQVATEAIRQFLENSDINVYLVVFDQESFNISENRFADIEKYIDQHYVEEHTDFRRRLRDEDGQDIPYSVGSSFSQISNEAIRLSNVAPSMKPAPTSEKGKKLKSVLKKNKVEEDKVFTKESESSYDLFEPLEKPSFAPKEHTKRSLDEVVSQLEESFSQRLLRLIDEKGLTDVAVYRKANLDRRLFSKIRLDQGYNPSKVTAIALAIAIELNVDETKDLLAKAGYTLSRSSKFDVIIEYFMESGIYDVFAINEALFKYDLVLLGA